MRDVDFVNGVIKYGCSSCFIKLIDLHSSLFYKIAGKYTYALALYGISKEEIFDNKNFIFLDSIRSFDSKKKVKFSSWMGNKTRFFCLNILTSRNKIMNYSSDEIKKIIESQHHSENKDKQNEDFAYIMFLLDNLKDKRIKQIFHLRYLEKDRKVKWSIIAKKLNISVQTAINLHSRATKTLLTKIKSNKTYDLV